MSDTSNCQYSKLGMKYVCFIKGIDRTTHIHIITHTLNTYINLFYINSFLNIPVHFSHCPVKWLRNVLTPCQAVLANMHLYGGNFL